MMVWFIFEDVPEAIGVNFEPDDADKEGDETDGRQTAGSVALSVRLNVRPVAFSGLGGGIVMA